MLGCLVVGVVLGAVTGMPVGAVGVTIIDTASRRPLRRAVGIGIGAGLGDLWWAAVSLLGVGPLLAGSPSARPVLYAVSGAALIAYGALGLRSRRARSQAGRHAPPGAPLEPGHGRTGFAVGLGLVAASPASLVTWVALVGMFLPDTAGPAAIAAVIGVGLGSAGWFVILAHIARRGTRLLGERTAWIPSVSGMLLIGYGLFSLARGARYWIHGLM